MTKGTVKTSELNSFVVYSRLPAVAGDKSADLVSRNFDSVVISKRVCGVRLFGVLEGI